MRKQSVAVLITILLFLFGVVALLTGIITIFRNYRIIKNGFVIYFDGEEVDVKQVDISFYKTSIDYDNKVIYATKK